MIGGIKLLKRSVADDADVRRGPMFACRAGD